MAALLCAYVWLGSAYALRTPIWQVPDEPAHYNYVAQVAANTDPPEIASGDYPFQRLEDLKSRRFPPGESIAGIEYEDHQPPAYYYLAAVVYRAVGGDDSASETPLRVRAIRLLGVLLGMLTVAGTWLTGRWLAPREPEVALGAAAFAAALPMHLAMSAAVNNDALAIPVGTLLIAVAVRQVLHPWSPRAYGWRAGSLLGLALWTKLTLYPLALPIALAGALSARPGTQDRPTVARIGYLTALTPLFIAAVTVAPWLLRNAVAYGSLDILALGRHAEVVLGQPRTAAWIARLGAVDTARQGVATTFKSFWGVFGWMGVPMESWVYALLALASAVAGAGLLRAAVNGRFDLAEHAPGRRSAFLVLLAAIVATGLALVAYNLEFVQHQGRYLFPALGATAVLFTLGLRETGRWLAARIAPPLVPVAGVAITVAFAAGLALLAAVSIERYIVPWLSPS